MELEAEKSIYRTLITSHHSKGFSSLFLVRFLYAF